jgi:hypothetical protein
MAENIFNQGRLEAVFLDMGTFEGSTKKYVRAPFSLLKLNGNLYVQPVNMPGGFGESSYNGLTGNAESEELNLAREEFYHTLDIHRLGDHQFGAWKSDDSWRGMFKLGMV